MCDPESRRITDCKDLCLVCVPYLSQTPDLHVQGLLDNNDPIRV